MYIRQACTTQAGRKALALTLTFTLTLTRACLSLEQIDLRPAKQIVYLLKGGKKASPVTMGSKGEAPTWADQWASGEDSGSRSTNRKADKRTVAGNVKAAASEGFVKAKAAALVGAHKVKAGTSTGIKWVKEQYHKKRTSK